MNEHNKRGHQEKNGEKKEISPHVKKMARLKGRRFG